MSKTSFSPLCRHLCEMDLFWPLFLSFRGMKFVQMRGKNNGLTVSVTVSVSSFFCVPECVFSLRVICMLAVCGWWCVYMRACLCVCLSVCGFVCVDYPTYWASTWKTQEGIPIIKYHASWGFRVMTCHVNWYLDINLHFVRNPSIIPPYYYLKTSIILANVQ